MRISEQRLENGVASFMTKRVIMLLLA
jgi:hypothetical protein